ncbi:MAG TPA: hypothetical protein VFK22_01245 [Candidatus Dormibacteraeota bacterium]|nr:hypothetical protein [Candidatus Dormibacteraeota bacterium]
MNRLRRLLPIVGLAGVLAAAGAAASGTTGLAYGAADQPVAQVEVSANCDNPSFPFCANVVGTGGIWFWVELDANHTGDLSGADCGHTIGGGGAGLARSRPAQYSGSTVPLRSESTSSMRLTLQTPTASRTGT